MLYIYVHTYNYTACPMTHGTFHFKFCGVQLTHRKDKQINAYFQFTKLTKLRPYYIVFNVAIIRFFFWGGSFRGNQKTHKFSTGLQLRESVKNLEFLADMTDHAGPRRYECNRVFQIVTREICNLMLKFHNPMKICGTR